MSAPGSPATSNDTLAQEFSSIVLLARAAQARDDSDLRALIGQIEATARAGLTESRRVVAALAPADLADAGLAAALGRLVDALGEQTGVDAQLRIHGDLGGLPTGVEVALLRTAQGALANVRRHAQASRVVVSLTATDESVRLDVVDDGVGFDPTSTPPATPNEGGYGLIAGRNRLRELGGTLDIESAPGEGTALSASVPLGDGA